MKGGRGVKSGLWAPREKPQGLSRGRTFRPRPASPATGHLPKAPGAGGGEGWHLREEEAPNWGQLWEAAPLASCPLPWPPVSLNAEASASNKIQKKEEARDCTPQCPEGAPKDLPPGHASSRSHHVHCTPGTSCPSALLWVDRHPDHGSLPLCSQEDRVWAPGHLLLDLCWD